MFQLNTYHAREKRLILEIFTHEIARNKKMIEYKILTIT